MLSPLFWVVAFLIKAEGIFSRQARGHIFYREKRITQGRPFWIYKFRIVKKEILDEEPFVRRRDRQKSLEKDSHCTAMGRLLKRIYLDELPQILNILRGEMSLVGPRPFPVDDYTDDLSQGIHTKRLVKSGLTGPTQASKGLPGKKGDVELDYEYIRKCASYSPWRLFLYDLSILARTLRIIFRAEGL